MTSTTAGTEIIVYAYRPCIAVTGEGVSQEYFLKQWGCDEPQLAIEVRGPDWYYCAYPAIGDDWERYLKPEGQEVKPRLLGLKEELKMPLHQSQKLVTDPETVRKLVRKKVPKELADIILGLNA